MFHANGAPRFGIHFTPDSGDGAGTGGAGSTGQNGGTGDDGDDDGDDGAGDSVQAAAKLRDALNKERSARKAAERELKPLKTAAQQRTDADKTDAQKAQDRAAAADARVQQLESVVRQGRVERAVRGIDRSQNLGMHDPDFVAEMLRLDDADFDEDGTPDQKAVEAAVKQLIKARPYLAQDVPPQRRNGSGDGGAGGTGAQRPPSNDMNAMIRRAAGH